MSLQIHHYHRYLEDDDEFNHTFDIEVKNFTPPVITESFANSARFGHSTSFASLFGTSEESQDYVTGLLILGACCVIFFTVWLLVIVLLYCCGRRCAGFLSGHRFHQIVYVSGEVNNNTNINSNETQESSTSIDKEIRSNTKDSANCIRWIFVLSGIIYILFSILLSTQGLRNIQNSVTSINEASSEVMNLTGVANNAVTSSQKILKEQLANISASLSMDLSNDLLCPAFANANVNVTILRNSSQRIIQAINDLSQFDGGALDSLSKSLLSNQETATSMYKLTKDVDATPWPMIVFTSLNAIVPCFLIVSALLAMYGTTDSALHCMVVWIFIPLFFLLVIGSAILSSASVILASSNSDYCYPESVDQTNPILHGAKHYNPPDVSSLQVLQNTGMDPGTLEFAVASFYITQCTADNPYVWMKNFIPIVEEGFESLNATITNFNQSGFVESLSAQCGRDYSGLYQALISTEVVLRTLGTLTRDLLSFIRCDTIVPIYQKASYTTLCSYSVKAFIWIFSASFIMSFFGFLMITLRASCYETTYIHKLAPSNERSNIEPKSENENIEVVRKHDVDSFQTVSPSRETVEDYGSSVM